MNENIKDSNEEFLEKELQALMKEFWKKYKDRNEELKEIQELVVESINN